MALSFVTRHLHLALAVALAGIGAHLATSTSNVAVASRDLFPNEIISSGDVRMAPLRDALPGSFTTLDGLAGMQVVSRIPKGYPVVKGSIRGKPGVGLTLADSIPDGEHAIYKFDAQHAQLPGGYVRAGDQVLISVVLKVDPQQEAQARQALMTPTATPSASSKATPSPTPQPAPGQQGQIILGSAYLAAPVVATDGLDGKSTSPGLQPWLSVMLSIDDLNALNTLMNSGFAQTTVSLADSRIKPVVTVNSLAALVAVLEKQQAASVALATDGAGLTPSPVQPATATPAVPTATPEPAARPSARAASAAKPSASR